MNADLRRQTERVPVKRNEILTLAKPPSTFFMTLRDVAFWVRSSRADARLNRHRQASDDGSAFDQLYESTSDPFGSELPQYRYQQRKYECLLSMLPQRRYRQALDIGCGLGAFTRKLAPFAEHVLGTDVSATALDQARTLSADCPNVAYALGNILELSNNGGLYDLIVVADTLYYVDPLTDERLKAIARNIVSRLTPGGLLMVVNHYFFGFDLASRTTREIHNAFRWATNIELVADHRRAFFLATLLQRSGA